jgi:hypothetical protein
LFQLETIEYTALCTADTSEAMALVADEAKLPSMGALGEG